MRSELIVAVVVEAFDGGLFDRAVHALDLAIGPRVVGLGEPVLDAVGLTDHVEAHRPGIDGVAVPGLLGELDAIISEDRVDAIRDDLEQMFEELPRRFPVGLLEQLRDSELACAVDLPPAKSLTVM